MVCGRVGWLVAVHLRASSQGPSCRAMPIRDAGPAVLSTLKSAMKDRAPKNREGRGAYGQNYKPRRLCHRLLALDCLSS